MHNKKYINHLKVTRLQNKNNNNKKNTENCKMGGENIKANNLACLGNF